MYGNNPKCIGNSPQKKEEAPVGGVSEREKRILLWLDILLVALAIVSALALILSYPR